MAVIAMEPDVDVFFDADIVTLRMPAVQSSDGSGDSFRPELDLIDYPVDEANPEEQLIAALTARLVWAMHESVEWMTVDGVKVFNPHPSYDGDDTELFQKMADQAHKLATWMARKHPRHSPAAR